MLTASTSRSTITFFRARVAKQALSVKFTSSKDQLADILTKPLVSSRFSILRGNLTVCANPLQLRGCNDSKDIPAM
jgi:hypothetical protein